MCMECGWWESAPSLCHIRHNWGLNQNLRAMNSSELVVKRCRKWVGENLAKHLSKEVCAACLKGKCLWATSPNQGRHRLLPCSNFSISFGSSSVTVF